MASMFGIDDRARHHLVLSDRQGWPATRVLLRELADRGASRTCLRPTQARSDRDLADRLGQQAIGTHLYVAGRAPWVARVLRLAEGAGMLPSEVDAVRIGSPASHVFCIVCHSLFAHPQHNAACCPHCGASLWVTDHCSDRLDAAMGAVRLTQAERGHTDGQAVD